jgi:Ferritin-like domain
MLGVHRSTIYGRRLRRALHPPHEDVRAAPGGRFRRSSHARQGGKPYGCVSQLLFEDTTDFVPVGEMVKRLMQDNGHLAKMIREAIAVCDENRDSATSNALQEILDETERRKWFLFEIMQGVNTTD